MSDDRDRAESGTPPDQNAEPLAGSLEAEAPPELGAPIGTMLPEEFVTGTSPFAHPQWTVGVVLIMAAVMLFLGIFGHPVWFLIGAPFILTLAVWVAVRVFARGGDPEGTDR